MTTTIDSRERMSEVKADALEQLFIEYYNDALLYSLSLCRDRSNAEEIVATAFFKALSTIGEINDFKAWLLTVCRNTYISNCRKQARYTELHEYLADDSEDLIDKIIKDDEYKALYHAIGHLPKEQNEVITLFYFENLSVRSVAQIMGKKETAVKVLLYRARVNLRKLLEG
ncbi:MAG: sigma-70 family RNA polymerase sigma factor [Ruminococcaceae bacterium]|nr:sigma-70 family RNA polymerase sigma factor [Oscillospiraceae bacterium]